MSFLHIELFNGLHIQRKGQPVTLAYDKVRALFAYLVLESTRPLRRDTLTALLWPEQPDKEARHNLSQALLKLRQSLDTDDTLLLTDRRTVQLNPTAAVEVDVAHFESHLRDCKSHSHARPEICDVCMDAREAAVKLYQGDFLAGISIPDAPDFEDWLVVWRERLHQQAIDALDALTAYHERRGEVAAALDYAREQIRLEPWREEAHRQAMRLLLYNGQRSAALAQYQRCVQILADEFGVPPAPETEALFQLIQTTDAQPPHNLPPQATPFLGRQTELAELSSFIANPDCRLLTLVGPGGIGKTRLALAVAERQLGRPTAQFEYNAPNVGFFTHGVYWVSLVGLETAVGLIPIIANTLGLQLESSVRASSGRSAQQQLLDYLREKRLLVLLDNFEQFLTKEEATASTTVLRAILQVAPQVQLLVTSRERLQLPEEQLYQLHGLDYPDVEVGDVADGVMETENQEGLDVTSYASVALFTQIARHIQPDFLCNGPAARTVVQICQKLRGMPLAIELAAASINVWSTTEILAELRQSLDVLSTTTRHIPARHRSIRAAFESSWQHLHHDEQTTFQKLSVFRGGFTREAAYAVADASLTTLAELTNKSFIRFRQETERYEIHELMRQFGAEKLEQTTLQADHVAYLHSAYIAEKLRQWAIEVKGEQQQRAHQEMVLESENIRLGWQWAIVHGQAELLVQAIDGPGFHYQWQGRYLEGLEIYERTHQMLFTSTGRALELKEPLLKALTWQGIFMDGLGKTDSAIALLEETLKADEATHSDPSLPQSCSAAYAFLYHSLGQMTINLTRDQAKIYLDKSLVIYERLADKWGLGQVYNSLGKLARESGNYPAAKELAQKSLELRKEIGDLSGCAESLGLLGLISMDMGELDQAETFMFQQLALNRELRSPLGIATSLDILGLLHMMRGQFESAQGKFEERLAMLHDLGVQQKIGLTAIWLGIAHFNQGRYHEAHDCAQTGLSIMDGAGDLWTTGHAKMLLGYTELALGKFDKARAHLNLCVELFQELGQQDELSQAWAWMSYVELANEQFQAAQCCLTTCLHIALDVRTLLPLLEALPAIVKLLIVQEEPEMAIEIHTMAMQFPMLTTSRAFEDLVGQPAIAAEEVLPVEVVAAAQERGRQRDLWETAAELLTQFAT